MLISKIIYSHYKNEYEVCTPVIKIAFSFFSCTRKKGVMATFDFTGLISTVNFLEREKKQVSKEKSLKILEAIMHFSFLFPSFSLSTHTCFRNGFLSIQAITDFSPLFFLGYG